MQIENTPFGMSVVSTDPPLDIAFVLAQLPPLSQARELISHFAQTMQQTIAIFHMPSARAVIEQVYETINQRDIPPLENLLTLFAVFAGAAHACTSQMLERLDATEDAARAAFTAYSHLAMQIVAHPPLSSSTICLAAMATLLHLLISADGVPMAVSMLYSRCQLMSRAMQLHRLDAAGRRAERRKGCDMVELEVQRRVWWDTVAGDW
jgi:hypothetical protein